MTMADEPQAGTVSADNAMMLLLLDGPAELKRLQRNGAFKPMAPGRYGWSIWCRAMCATSASRMRASRCRRRRWEERDAS